MEITQKEQDAWHAGIDAGREIERNNAAAGAEPVLWYRPRTGSEAHSDGRCYDVVFGEPNDPRFIPLYTAPVAAQAQPAICGYTCTVPDDCETLHWRGQILSMNELASVAQPAASAEPIHQYRVRNCSDWYDGLPDTSDGKDYETRTLYSAPIAAQAQPDHFRGVAKMMPAQQPVSGADVDEWKEKFVSLLVSYGDHRHWEAEAEDKRAAVCRTAQAFADIMAHVRNAQPQPSGEVPSRDVAGLLHEALAAIESSYAKEFNVSLRKDIRAALAAQASGNGVKDPLQPAADWLVNYCGVDSAAELAGRLHLGHNRAQRLIDAARAAAKEQS